MRIRAEAPGKAAAGTSLSVARLLELRVPVSWQEAVAVVDAADRQSASGAAALSLQRCHVSTAGTVQLSVAGVDSTDQELSTLQLLRALLQDPSAPEGLRALVSTADQSPGDGGQARPRFEFGWIVGPSPHVEIARLAARGLAADLAAAVARRQELLGRKPAEPPITTPAPSPPPAITLRVARLPRRVALALAVLLATVAAGAAVARLGVGGQAGATAIVSLLSGAVSSVSAAVSGAAEEADSTAPSEGAVSKPSSPARPRARGADPATARADELLRSAPAAAAPLASTVTIPPDAATSVVPATAAASSSPSADTPLAAPASPDSAVRPPDIGARIYTSDDPEVTPPEPLRPHLPSERRADTEQSFSQIELVIDEQGLVQRVRLRSDAISLNDRMIVAAAKAWRFRPATREGRPVPYLLRLPVTR